MAKIGGPSSNQPIPIPPERKAEKKQVVDTKQMIKVSEKTAGAVIRRAGILGKGYRNYQPFKDESPTSKNTSKVASNKLFSFFKK